MTVDLSSIANQGVAAAMFVAFITMLLKGHIVLGRELDAMRDERNFWRDAADRVLNLSEVAIDIDAKTTKRMGHERR